MITPQKSYLPLGSLKGALFYPEPDLPIGNERLAAALERVGLGALSSRLDEVARWDQVLSNGERQRLGVARLLLHKPQVAILDDALSAVDTHTEEEILERLSAAKTGRTAIVVSHRVSTIRDADQIVVLHEGRVAERGTHDELIRRDGLYADLYRKQLLEEELKAS